MGLLLFALWLAACQATPPVPSQNPPLEGPATAALDLHVPPGFTVTLDAEGLDGVRTLVFSPEGDLFAALSSGGLVLAFAGGNLSRPATFLDGLERPFGLAFHEGWVYIAEETRVIRARDTNGDLSADVVHVVLDGLPSGGHWTRTLLGTPDGFYLAVGSSCNLCEEDNAWRAAVHWCTWEGTCRLYAKGARNFVGLAQQPDSLNVWATENGRDWQGDDAPPDELNLLHDGGDFGWPFCQGRAKPDPEYSDPTRCAATVPSALDIQAHSAPLGFTFYAGDAFPDEYRGDAFVAFHGSWNRADKTGYKVVRIDFEDGQPTQATDFLWGFLQDGDVSGRPVWVAEAPDGSLLVSDDGAGRLFRVKYVG